MIPTIRELNYFIAVARSGSISNAANNISISQSAITSSIISLESKVGVMLFERHSKGMSLTYEGYLFYERAKHIIASLEDAIRISQKKQETIRGNIKIGLTYTVFGYFLPNILNQFIRIYPEIQLEILEFNRTQVENKLQNNSIDLGIILTSNIDENDEFEFDELLKSRRRIWLPCFHRLLNSSKITFKEISKEPYIMFTKDEAEITTMRYWQKSPYKLNVKYRTSSVEAVRSMVASGLGITVLSDMVYRNWSLNGEKIEVREVDEQIPTMNIGMVWRAGRDLRPEDEALKDFLKRFISNSY